MSSVKGNIISIGEIKEVEERLNNYRELIKQQGSDGYFLESQIDILEVAITELKKSYYATSDRANGGLYEYTLQAVVVDIESRVQNIMNSIKEK